MGALLLEGGGARDQQRARGLVLTPDGATVDRVDEKKLAREVQLKRRGHGKKRKEHEAPEPPDDGGDEGQPEGTDWKHELLEILHDIPADAFERLCQRLLRENGFVEVVVTGKSGDGGIDGMGLLRLQDVVTFRVAFQAKRWRRAVDAASVRDFRGASQGAPTAASSSRRATSRAMPRKRRRARACLPSTSSAGSCSLGCCGS